MVEDEAAAEELPEVKDLRSDKKIENKEKQVKKKANEVCIIFLLYIIIIKANYTSYDNSILIDSYSNTVRKANWSIKPLV